MSSIHERTNCWRCHLIWIGWKSRVRQFRFLRALSRTPRLALLNSPLLEMVPSPMFPELHKLQIAPWCGLIEKEFASRLPHRRAAMSHLAFRRMGTGLPYLFKEPIRDFGFTIPVGEP